MSCMLSSATRMQACGSEAKSSPVLYMSRAVCSHSAKSATDAASKKEPGFDGSISPIILRTPSISK